MVVTYVVQSWWWHAWYKHGGDMHGAVMVVACMARSWWWQTYHTISVVAIRDALSEERAVWVSTYEYRSVHSIFSWQKFRVCHGVSYDVHKLLPVQCGSLHRIAIKLFSSTSFNRELLQNLIFRDFFFKIGSGFLQILQKVKKYSTMTSTKVYLE